MYYIPLKKRRKSNTDIRAWFPVDGVFQCAYVGAGAVDVAGLHGFVVDHGLFAQDCFQHLYIVVELDGIVVADIEDFIGFAVGFLYDSGNAFHDVVDIGEVPV